MKTFSGCILSYQTLLSLVIWHYLHLSSVLLQSTLPLHTCRNKGSWSYIRNTYNSSSFRFINQEREKYYHIMIPPHNNKYYIQYIITCFPRGCLTQEVHYAQLFLSPPVSALVPELQHAQHIDQHNKLILQKFLYAVLDLTQSCHEIMQCTQLHVWSAPVKKIAQSIDK